MNPMLQRHCAKFIYLVPDGLRELMSDISREVIRSQPEQIYTYIADYLDALMITRENARIAARLVDSICEIAETTVELLLQIGLSRSEADAIVAVIQTAFRAYLERKKKCPYATELPGELGEEEELVQQIMNEINVSADKIEEAAIVIQTAWRKFKERQEREKKMLFGMVDWRIAARSAIMLYRKTGVTMYEANRAATLIKAAYKGYYTRRIMKRLLHMGLEDDASTQIESTISEDIDLASETGELPTYLSQIDSYGEDASIGLPSQDYLDFEIGGQPVDAQHRGRRHQLSKTDKVVSAATSASVSAAAGVSTTSKTKTGVKSAPTDDGRTLTMDRDLLHPEDGAFAEFYSAVESLGHSVLGESTENQPEMRTPPNTEQEISEPMEAEAEETDIPVGDETGDAPGPTDEQEQPADVEEIVEEAQPVDEGGPTTDDEHETTDITEGETDADDE